MRRSANRLEAALTKAETELTGLAHAHLAKAPSTGELCAVCKEGIHPREMMCMDCGVSLHDACVRAHDRDCPGPKPYTPAPTAAGEVMRILQAFHTDACKAGKADEACWACKAQMALVMAQVAAFAPTAAEDGLREAAYKEGHVEGQRRLGKTKHEAEKDAAETWEEWSEEALLSIEQRRVALRAKPEASGGSAS